MDEVHTARDARVVASIALSEPFLNELLRRIRHAEAFPSSVVYEFPLPGIGLVGAELHLDVDHLRLRLRRSEANRIRIEASMSGEVLWDVALRRIAQSVEVHFAIDACPMVALDSDGDVVLGVDFTDSRVSSVQVAVLDTPYLPGAVPTELLGPIGRRLLDSATSEALGMFVRNLGVRETKLEGPIGTWLAQLGAALGRCRCQIADDFAQVDIFDGCSDDHEDVPLLDAGSATSILVLVHADFAPGLLRHWMLMMIGTGEPQFSAPDFAFDDGRVKVRTTVCGKVPILRARVEAVVTLALLFEIDGEHLRFASDGVTVERISLRGLRSFAARLAERWIDQQPMLPASWRLVVPFVPDHTWILGITSLDVQSDAIRVQLGSWFAPV